MPRQLFESDLVDVRVLVGAALIVPAFITIHNQAERYKTTALIGTTAVICLTFVIVQSVWLSYRSDYRAMQASFGLIPPYARIIAARGDADSGIDRRLYPIYYAPTLAAYERHAFVPQLYALPGVQPLSGAASVSRLMIRYANEHRLVSISFLQKIADGHIDDNDPPYLRTWTADYDYLYLTGPHTPNPLPDLLTEMMTAARFTLYKIRHDSADPAMPSDHAVNR